MKSLQESLLDINDVNKSLDEVFEKEQIMSFLNTWYENSEPYEIIKENNKWIVNCPGEVEMKYQNEKGSSTLTNGNFEFGVIGENFSCRRCYKLKNLKGAPRKVGWDFVCFNCTGLKNLEGGPEYVGSEYNIAGCTGLKSLKGLAKEIKFGLRAKGCYNLTDLKPMKKSKIDKNVDFSGTDFTFDDIKANLANPIQVTL